MNSANVSAAKPPIKGAIFTAPLGTVLPTDATSNLDTAFLPLGYVSKEGVSNANTATSQSTTAWGGDVVLDGQTDKPDTFKFTLIEALSENVLKFVYGDKNVTGSLKEGIHVTANREEAQRRVLVIDMILKGAVKRIVLPDAKITEVDEILYKDADAIGYGTKLSAYPDKDGTTHHEYIKATT